MGLTYMTMRLTEIALPDWGWTLDDPEIDARLERSIERHGQLAPMLVRRAGGIVELVCGRRVLRALQRLGSVSGNALDLGPISRMQAIELALAMEVKGEPDYVRLARGVSELAASEPEAITRLPAASPFSAQRLRDFVQLADFDWTTLGGGDKEQTGFDFDFAEPAAAPAVAPLVPSRDPSEEILSASDAPAASAPSVEEAGESEPPAELPVHAPAPAAAAPAAAEQVVPAQAPPEPKARRAKKESKEQKEPVDARPKKPVPTQLDMFGVEV